jgi:hypothetical protein
MQPTTRMVPAVAVALLAGALRATQVYAPQLLSTGGVPMRHMSTVVTGIGVLSLAVSPFGVATAGYLWRTDVDVGRRWLRLVGATLAAALAGFVATYLLLTAVVALGPTPPRPGELAVWAAFHLLTAVGLVGVPLVALAGAAVAQFRSRPAARGGRPAHGAE